MSPHPSWREVLIDGALAAHHGVDLLFGTVGIHALEAAAYRTLEPLTLMARAGEAATNWLRTRAPRGHVPLVADPGNSGGDTPVAATVLHLSGRAVTVWPVVGLAKLPDDVRHAWTKACAANIPVGPLHTVASVPAAASVIVNGLSGVGLTRPLTGLHVVLVDTINASGLSVYTLDIPSGLNGDTGQPPAAESPVIQVRVTTAFLAVEPGLLTGDGRDASGNIALADLQAVQPAYGGVIEADVLANTPSCWFPHVSRRRHDGHKGIYGSATAAGGAAGMVGTLLPSARSVLHLGAGKMHVVLLAPDVLHVNPAQSKLMLHGWGTPNLNGIQTLAMGPGMSADKESEAALEYLLDRMLTAHTPAMFDVDALNFFVKTSALLVRLTQSVGNGMPLVLAPYPLEAARLLHTDVHTVQQDRPAAAQALINRTGAVVAFKGSGTIVAVLGTTPAVNPTGNGGFVTGGTGDMLTGMVGALLMQDMGVRETALAAVWLHGRAVDDLVHAGVDPIGLHASELRAPAWGVFNVLPASDVHR